MAAYRTAVRAFLAFLLFYNLVPVDGPQMDDFLLEWKNDNIWPGGAPSKSTFQFAIAGVEKAHPQLKGELQGAREALNSWQVVVAPHHTVPIGRP